MFQVKSQMLQSSLSIATERSHSSEEHPAALLVGTWYYLTPDSSGALVSEIVDRKDLALERTHALGHHFTSTGLTDGHNNESDCAMEDNVFLARNSDEVYPKHLSLDDRIAFEIADAAEWKAIVDTGSVKVLDSEVANTIRKKQPDRVINSRMVRRLKPQEGTFQKPKAKSRWCVLGHQDPDAADMFTYAPTPQTESIMMFLFLLQLCDLALSIADLKNAFCQSDSLDRSAGLRGFGLATWVPHATCCPGVRSQRCPSSMASYLDNLAHQARISKVSAGTLSVRALRSWRKRGRTDPQ